MDADASEEWHDHLHNGLSIKSDRLRIRLLRLKAGEGTAPIEGEMFRTTLVDSPSYEALSYTWGTSEQRKSMLVNGFQVSITNNLDYALRNLRTPLESRIIWVDALCINQSDLEERNAQVREMGEIYSFASRVLIWPREAPSRSDPSSSASDRAVVRCIRRLPNTPQPLKFGVIKDRLGSIRKLFGHRWWTRVWIIQEVARARSDPLMLLAKTSIYWSELASFANELASFANELWDFALYAGPPIINVLSATVLDQIRCATRIPPRLRDLEAETDISTINERAAEDMFFLLSQTETFEASDPRDKIFGLFTLIRSTDANTFQPDYGESISEVYKKAARAIMKSKRGIKLLARSSQVGYWDNSRYGLALQDSPASLPSWVPDFSIKPKPYFPINKGLNRILDDTQHHFLGDKLMVDGYNLGSINKPYEGENLEEDQWLDMAALHLSQIGVIKTPSTQWVNPTERDGNAMRLWMKSYGSLYDRTAFETSSGIKGLGAKRLKEYQRSAGKRLNVVILDGVPTALLVSTDSAGESISICGNVWISGSLDVDWRSAYNLERKTFTLV